MDALPRTKIEPLRQPGAEASGLVSNNDRTPTDFPREAKPDEPSPANGSSKVRLEAVASDGRDTALDSESGTAPGEQLRKARELRGESLEAVAETLNLRPDVLAGLERGDYSVLPSPAYTGPFVRSYAKYLELDAEALASQARAEVSVGEDLGGFAQARQVPSKPSRSLFLILAVILVVVGGMAWAFTQWGGQLTTAESVTERGAGTGSAALEAQGQDTAAAATPASEDSAEAGMAADTRAGQAGTEPEAADAAGSGADPRDTQSAAENTAPSNRAGEPAPLEVMPVARTFGPGDMSNGPALQAEREAWLRVENADGLVVFVGRLQSGDVFAALEGKGFVASVRDAGAFRVLYDGSPVARLGDDGIARPTVILDRFGQMG